MEEAGVLRGLSRMVLGLTPRECLSGVCSISGGVAVVMRVVKAVGMGMGMGTGAMV